jgi:hypothetical protein
VTRSTSTDLDPLAYDPEVVARLVAEAREDDQRMADAPWGVEDGRLYSRGPLSANDLGPIELATLNDGLAGDDGIARSRNNLRALADQLMAASAEAERLRSLVPICAHCEDRPVACFGHYEDGESRVGPLAACDRCCGHGNEDGWCVPIVDLPGWAASVDLTADDLSSPPRRRTTEAVVTCRVVVDLRIDGSLVEPPGDPRL